MWDQGIRHVITTPHFRASTISKADEFEAHMSRIDEGWEALVAAVAMSFPEMRMDRGVELALDEPMFPVSDRRLRLAGTKFILVEFPSFTIPPNSARALAQLARLGATPIIAHPERYENVGHELGLLIDWKQSGAFLQLNAGSLLGVYGSRPEKRAWEYLEAGVVDYLSSDYHSRGRCLVFEAEKRIADRGGESQFRILSSVNGTRLLAGIEPSPVPPLVRTQSRWERLTGALRRKR